MHAPFYGKNAVAASSRSEKAALVPLLAFLPHFFAATVVALRGRPALRIGL